MNNSVFHFTQGTEEGTKWYSGNFHFTGTPYNTDKRKDVNSHKMVATNLLRTATGVQESNGS